MFTRISQRVQMFTKSTLWLYNLDEFVCVRDWEIEPRPCWNQQDLYQIERVDQTEKTTWCQHDCCVSGRNQLTTWQTTGNSRCEWTFGRYLGVPKCRTLRGPVRASLANHLWPSQIFPHMCSYKNHTLLLSYHQPREWWIIMVCNVYSNNNSLMCMGSTLVPQT